MKSCNWQALLSLKFGRLTCNLPANLMHENPVQFAEMDVYIPVLEELFDMQAPWIIRCHFFHKTAGVNAVIVMKNGH